MRKRNNIVFVGLSGGVDSSVAALRLKKQGYDVVGVFIKVWHPDFLECDWERERLDAMRVAAKLDIPFLMCDAEAEYKRDVADYFIQQYVEGKTPNPDVMCNKYVKFGAFLKFARAHNADYIATGHYAQNIRKDEHYELHRGIDHSKDQSYFLWTLTQSELAQVLFPIGNATKSAVRKEAARSGLLTASKKDSQGICFLGHVDIPEFLSHYTPLTNGHVLNEEGEIIGEHKGALVYTTGQRHGFIVYNKQANNAPMYVIRRDLEANTVTVSEHKPQSHLNDVVMLAQCNFVTSVPEVGQHVFVQTRYRQVPVAATITSVTEKNLELAYTKEGELPASGQSCVLYEGMRVIGGGIIQ